jgi:hypothetical protein
MSCMVYSALMLFFKLCGTKCSESKHRRRFPMWHDLFVDNQSLARAQHRRTSARFTTFLGNKKGGCVRSSSTLFLRCVGTLLKSQIECAKIYNVALNFT